MKIVALMGSPAGANTDTLVDHLLEGARAEKAETVKIVLNGLAIQGCQACYHCKKTGACRYDDGMTAVYPELLAADAWVFATPVYWWGPSAQLKLALDRLFPFCHGRMLEAVKGKRFALVAASEDDPRAAAPHLKGMMKEACAYLSMKWAGALTVQAYKKGEVRKNPEALAQARDLGRKIAKSKPQKKAAPAICD